MAERRHRRPRDVRRPVRLHPGHERCGPLRGQRRARRQPTIAVFWDGTSADRPRHPRRFLHVRRGYQRCRARSPSHRPTPTGTPTRSSGRAGRSTELGTFGGDRRLRPGHERPGPGHRRRHDRGRASRMASCRHGVMYDVMDLLPAAFGQGHLHGKITEFGVHPRRRLGGRAGPAGPRADAAGPLTTSSTSGRRGSARAMTSVIDMNAARHVIGCATTIGAFWYDGTSASILLDPVRRVVRGHQRERRHRRERTTQRPSGGVPLRRDVSTSSARLGGQSSREDDQRRR